MLPPVRQEMRDWIQLGTAVVAVVAFVHTFYRAHKDRAQHTVLLWCRDAQNTWRSELAEGKAPDPVDDAVLDLGPLKLGKASARLYDPWENRWTKAGLEGDRVRLPAFKRSLVVRLTLEVKG